MTATADPAPKRASESATEMVQVVLPIAVHGFREWTPRVTHDADALSPELVRQLRDLPPRTVVIAPLETSYRILALRPVYVVAAPISHVADTKANRPNQRAKDVAHWLATGDPAVVKRYGALWAVRKGVLYRLTG